MCMNKGNNNVCCCIFSIIASLIAAVGIAGVFYTGLITSVATLIYFTLILGVLGILYILLTVFCGGRYQCKSLKESCLITTSIGSLVTSAFALSLGVLPIASITVGILVLAVAFFLITHLITFANVIVGKACSNRCED